MENFEDFNPRTALLIATVADELEVSRTDVEACIADNDEGYDVAPDHFDKLTGDEWNDAVAPIVMDLIKRGAIALDGKRQHDFAIEFAKFLSALRKKEKAS